MKIETKRLFLSPISNDAMRELIEKEPNPDMRQAYSEMLQGCLDHPALRIWNAVWFMELKDEPGTIVGDFCFKGLGTDGVIEIGYGLKDGCCGHGYMTEAVQAVCKWALMQDGVRNIEAEAEEENTASHKVLLRAGFERNGVMGAEGPRYTYRGI